MLAPKGCKNIPHVVFFYFFFFVLQSDLLPLNRVKFAIFFSFPKYSSDEVS